MADIYEITTEEGEQVGERAQMHEVALEFEYVEKDELEWESGRPYLCFLTVIDVPFARPDQPNYKAISVISGIINDKSMMQSLWRKGFSFSFAMQALSVDNNKLGVYIKDSTLEKYSQCFYVDIPEGGFTVDEVKEMLILVDSSNSSVVEGAEFTRYKGQLEDYINSLAKSTSRRTSYLAHADYDVNADPENKW